MTSPKHPMPGFVYNDYIADKAMYYEEHLNIAEMVRCIITEPANALVSSVHERMPAIIRPKLYDQWLDANNRDTSAIKIMAQHEEAYQNVICYPVTTKINRVAFNNDGCIKSLNSGNMNGNRQ